MTKKIEKMIGYKGFDKDWKCRNMEYKVGKSYVHDGTPKLCSEGLHFCENPLDLFGYYDPATGHFAEVEAQGVTDETESDSKRVAKKLKIKAELTLSSVIQLGVKFILDKVDFDNDKVSNTGYQSASTNTGDRSASTNTGDRSASTNTGYQSASTNTGNWSASSVIKENKEGVAISLGVEGIAAAPEGSWITLAEWTKDKDGEYHRTDVQTVVVDGKTVKADTFYRLESGKFVEAK